MLGKYGGGLPCRLRARPHPRVLPALPLPAAGALGAPPRRIPVGGGRALRGGRHLFPGGAQDGRGGCRWGAGWKEGWDEWWRVRSGPGHLPVLPVGLATSITCSRLGGPGVVLPAAGPLHSSHQGVWAGAGAGAGADVRPRPGAVGVAGQLGAADSWRGSGQRTARGPGLGAADSSGQRRARSPALAVHPPCVLANVPLPAAPATERRHQHGPGLLCRGHHRV